jgi:hypothetical protein
MTDMMAVVDGRPMPSPARLRNQAPQMYNLLRATLNILTSTGPERAASEKLLVRIIEVTIKGMEPAQDAQPAPPSSQAS